MVSAVVLLVAVSCGGRQSAAPAPSASTASASSSVAPPPSAVPAGQISKATIAFQVSHQDDTGFHNFHEWAISGDVALRALDEIDFAPMVLAWDLNPPLTGTNRYDPKPTNIPAFDSELAFSNKHHPDVFVAFHVDGGAPSGVYAVVNPGDSKSRGLATALIDGLSKDTGLPNRGVNAVHLYSLDPHNNSATYRVLLELGDNVHDLKFLENPADRQKMSDSIASTLRTFVEQTYGPGGPKGRYSIAIQPQAVSNEDPRIELAKDHIGPRPGQPWPESKPGWSPQS